MEVELETSPIRSNLLSCGSCAGHQFGYGVGLAVPGGYEQNFVAEGIPEYVVDIYRSVDFKEIRAARIRPVRQTSVEQKAQLGELLRRVPPKVFNHSR